MKNASKLTIVVVLYFLSGFCRAQSINDAQLELALQSAANNKSELQLFLSSYSKEKDSLKYIAARYLVENMLYHVHSGYVNSPDTSLINRVLLVDSLYYNLVKGKTLAGIRSKEVADSILKLSHKVRSMGWKGIKNGTKKSLEENPLRSISAQTLRLQLEHSFHLREENAMVKKLSFNDFCQYVLPFQVNFGRYVRLSSKELHDIIAKYIVLSDTLNVTESVKLYQATMKNLRRILGKYPLKYKTGFEEAFFNGVPGWDCYDASNFGTAFLNSVGIPSTSEYLIAYKMLQGRHSSCAVLEDIGDYTSFSLEGIDFYPIKKSDADESSYIGWMNVYREQYSPQKDSPIHLKATDEYIPHMFNSELIKDVTHLRTRTFPLTLPFDISTENHLCYLATFNSAEGKTIVTWGEIDKHRKTALFENVMPDRLYFPVYYSENGTMKDFGKPFMLQTLPNSSETFKKVDYNNLNSKRVRNVSITRKYPRKVNLFYRAKELIGTTVIGSNDSTFSTHDTLFVLKSVLAPQLQDLKINSNNIAYQYYQIRAPKKYPSMNLSEVQFLTDKRYNYKNTTIPTPLPALQPSAVERNAKSDKNLVRLLQPDTAEVRNWLVYDGKMETASKDDKVITLKLNEKQVITKLRVAPINADNGITVNNEYLLLSYVNGSWEPVEIKIATENHLFFKKLNTDTLYWLRNLTTGKEELPFLLNNKGQQKFIYNF